MLELRFEQTIDPPAKNGQTFPLFVQQIALLRQWIKEGAKWEDHWAFVPPKQQPLPAVKRSEWARQPLDRFILARLEKEGLAPLPETDKSALLRRVSLDLTGLPPTPEEQAAYLADSSPNAHEKQVDRLLESTFSITRSCRWIRGARPAAIRAASYENLRQQVLRRDGWRCQLCGTMSNPEIHHEQFRMPVRRGLRRNLIALRFACHASAHQS
jgi:hypothetical protein